MRFPDGGLSIGTEEDSNSPHITLPRAAAGVSRRHCSLRREGERTMLIDHSRFGTWVNGARVRERAAVRPGDRVRVGTPGVDFTLISASAFGASHEAGHEKAFAHSKYFTLSFLDCICCGFGAPVLLFYTIVQAHVGAQKSSASTVTGEVSKLEEEVKEARRIFGCCWKHAEKNDQDAAEARRARHPGRRGTQAGNQDSSRTMRKPGPARAHQSAQGRHQVSKRRGKGFRARAGQSAAGERVKSFAAAASASH